MSYIAPTTATALTPYDDKNNEATNSLNKDIILDSMPYIDNIHPDYEAYALTLIEEEMQKIGDPPSEETILRHLPNPIEANSTADATPTSFLSKSGLNRTEYEHLVARQGQPRSEVIDYREKMKSMKPNNKNNEGEWKAAIEKAKAELEYERLRMVNLELQSEYESLLWKHQTKNLEVMSKNMKLDLSQQQMKVDQINARRQDMQTKKAAPKLHVLSQKWDESLNRVMLLAGGVNKLNNEVKGFRELTGVSFESEAKLQASDDDDV